MSAEDAREALGKRLADEVEYRVRTAVALARAGHDHRAQVTEGRAAVLAILNEAEVDPRGTVTEAERAAINGALIDALPLWVDTIEEDHARRALLGSIVAALEAAARVSPETDS